MIVLCYISRFLQRLYLRINLNIFLILSNQHPTTPTTPTPPDFLSSRWTLNSRQLLLYLPISYFMSARKLNQLFNLPFIRSHNSGSRRFLTIAKVQTFLGVNFYPRLNNIYDNLVEAIAKKNYRYITSSFESTLASKIFDEMKSAEDGRFKFKIHIPSIKITSTRTKKLRKMLPIRQNIWDNNITKIGLQCNVYFGQKFDREDPLKKNQEASLSRVYRIGQFRYIRYYPQLSLFENIKNLYKEQTYELLVKYSSKSYLEVQNYDDVAHNTSPHSRKAEEEVITEMKMRTGNQKFDWVIIDINNMQNKIV